MTQTSNPGIDRPFTLLIAALGGEGGGLLTDWIVEACREDGVLVQTTSIPGVAQRTGATTYYIEMMTPASADAPEPLFALYPAPGYVDMAVASELVEAGRLVEAGFVTPDRTTLIASNHRVLAMSERTAMADGAFKAPRIADAANALAARTVLKDFAGLARSEHTALNAVLLGATSAAGNCPVSADAFEAAIRTRGVAVESNLKGFAAGRAWLEQGSGTDEAEASAGGTDVPPSEGLHARVSEFPDEARDVIHAGIDKLIDYQDVDYAGLYLDRLKPIAGSEESTDRRLTRETARHLALWMAYEDVIRVADLKTRSSRFARVRTETGAKPGEPVRITEFLKPGVEEAATVLPASLGRRLTAWADRRGLTAKLHVPLHIRTDTVTGYTLVRLLARLKGRRRKGLRYAQEQERIERWLEGIASSARVSGPLAQEWSECGRLIKGYSDTRERAIANFELLHREILTPALTGDMDPQDAARWLRDARSAALADEDGKALREVMTTRTNEALKSGAIDRNQEAAQAAE